MTKKSANKTGPLFRPARLLVVSPALRLMAAAFGFHGFFPAFVMVLQSLHHLRRGLVERSLFRLGGASLHALSVA